jgi:hypothetical protein
LSPKSGIDMSRFPSDAHLISWACICPRNLLEAIEALYPLMMLIHVFLDNARYHHAKLVQQ